MEEEEVNRTATALDIALLKLSTEQRDFYKIKIVPLLNTFVFKIFFFLISTSIVFFIAIIAAFIVTKLVEIVHNCLKVSPDLIIATKEKNKREDKRCLNHCWL